LETEVSMRQCTTAYPETLPDQIGSAPTTANQSAQ